MNMNLSTLRQDAYHKIRNKLMDGDLQFGDSLMEPALAKELGMSRTPIREALRQMENEGLVEYVPRFGVMVRMLERKELEDMYAVREALESYGAAEAALHITPEQLAKVKEAFGTMREIEDEFARSGEAHLPAEALKRFVTVDLQFHNLIMLATSNGYLAGILERTRLMSRIFTATFWAYTRESLAEANQFHRRLVDALEQRDAEAARQCTMEALRVSRKNALLRWDERQRNQPAKKGAR